MSLTSSSPPAPSLGVKGSDGVTSEPQEGKISNKKSSSSSNKKRGMAYNNVRHDGKIGKLIFNHRRLSFQPRGDNKDSEGKEGMEPLVRLSWEDVGFIEKSAPTAKRHKLKITSCFDNQILIFQTSNPDKLIKMFDEAHERLDEFHTYHEKKQQQLFINKKSTTTKTKTKSNQNKRNLESVFEQKNDSQRERDNTWNDTSLNWDEGSAFVTCSGGQDDDWNDSSFSLLSSPKRKGTTADDDDDASDEEEEDLFEDPKEEEEKDDDDAPNSVEIENVVWEGHPGRLVLQEDSVSFLEQDSKRCLFTLAWDKLRKHSSTSSTKKRPDDHQQEMLLKLYVDDETYEAFEVLNTTRERVSLLKQDMNRLQAAFLVNKIVVASPTTAGTTKEAEEWQPDDHDDDATSITQDLSMSASENTDPWLPSFLPSDAAPSKIEGSGGRSKPSSPKKNRGSAAKDKVTLSPTRKVTSPKTGGRRRLNRSRRSSLQLPLSPPAPLTITNTDRRSSAPSCFLPDERRASPVASTRGGNNGSSSGPLPSSPKKKKGSSRSKDKATLPSPPKKEVVVPPSQKQGGRHRLYDERSRSSRSSLRIPPLLSPPLVVRGPSPTTRKATTASATVATSTTEGNRGIADPEDIVDFFVHKAEKLLDQHELEPTTAQNKANINDEGFRLLDSSTSRRLEKLTPTTSAAVVTAMDSMIKANYLHERRSSLSALGPRRGTSGVDSKKDEEVRDDGDDRIVDVFIHKAQKLMLEHSNKNKRNNLEDFTTDSVKQQRRRGGSRRRRRSVC